MFKRIGRRTRRSWPGTFVVPAAMLMASAGWAIEPEDKQPLTKQPLTVQQVLDDKLEGQATITMHVEGWLQYRGASGGPGEPQTFLLKENVPGKTRLSVLVYPEVFRRLQDLGIEEPRRHFEDKIVVVSGTVHRNVTPSGAISVILWVKDLEQIRSIREVHMPR